MSEKIGSSEIKRAEVSYHPVGERIRHYREFVDYPDSRMTAFETKRCMDCGTPFCHSVGCPLGNLIPEINSSIARGDWKDAYLRLESKNSFPEITGRLCPALCQASCSLSISDSPVLFRNIEYRLAETAFSEGWVLPRPPVSENGISVAVIGSGPAGLAAAQQLRRSGFSVTVYEKEQKPGGLLVYGIPSFKLEKWVVERRIEQLEAEGVIFENGVNAGEDISPRYLMRLHNAVLLTQGSSVPRDVNALGRGLDNICFAMDFLSDNNRAVSGETGGIRSITAEGKKVLVIGGGDTGSDCVGTAVRQGAEKICQYEIMEEPADWESDSNPSWPYWPSIKRTSSSHKEGGERKWGIEVYQFSGRDICVEKAWCREVEWKTEKDPEGNIRKTMKRKNGSEFELEVDLVVIAAGFLHVEQSRFLNALGVKYDGRGNIGTDGNYRTSAENIYAAGDSISGPSLVARAINSGREAASVIEMDFS